jgi:hypothetical protein
MSFSSRRLTAIPREAVSLVVSAISHINQKSGLKRSSSTTFQPNHARMMFLRGINAEMFL